MKVLVTGSAGFIGTAVCKELQARGHDVAEYDLRRGQDIHDARKLHRAMAGQQAVVHLAAIPHPDKSKRWEAYWRANVAGTQAVAQAAAEMGVRRFVYASSTAYFGAHRGFPFNPADGLSALSPNAVQRYMGQQLPDMTPYNEAALAYACSKVAAETVLAAYGMSGRLDVSVLRFFPAAQNRQPYEWGLLMYRETGAAAVADALERNGTGYEVRLIYDGGGEYVTD